MIIENRKTEEFEDDRKKWKIYFDIETQGRRGDTTILISFLTIFITLVRSKLDNIFYSIIHKLYAHHHKVR